jgi:predicted Rossmann fold flavoprotein
MQDTDVVILGAGAAGLMCALTAGRRGRRVVVLDHARQAGEKILISGGGRCNFTNLHCAPERFLSANPHFCRSALARYTPRDFIDMLARHRIAWHEKTQGQITLGQLFCDGSARQIVAMLLAECSAVGVDVRLQQRIGAVSRADRFRVETDAGAIDAASLVLATGGLSIPKLGASGLSHDLARRFGLTLTEIRPGLVPLLLGGTELARIAGLAGVSARVGARCDGIRFDEGMVVTHRGLSGPAILQISSFWRAGAAVQIDLLPEAAGGFLHARKRARPKAGLRGVLGEMLSQRLADAFLPADAAGRPIGAIADRDLAALEMALHAWQVRPTGTEGYAKAEVTLGGIATTALSQRTMQSNAVPGLFAIGEAVDVTGWLGGYNFQWAWASGFVAGEAA